MFMFSKKNTAALAHLDVSSRDASVTRMSSTARRFKLHNLLKIIFTNI